MEIVGLLHEFKERSRQTMGINFDGVNPESKAKLEGIVKDGKITKEEMQGLTAAEKEALAKAFGGELPPIGDNFIVPSKVEAKAPKEKEHDEGKKRNGFARVVGGLSLGAAIGAALGAVVGSIVPGAGTLAGAKFGAIIGAALTGATSCTKEENTNQIVNINLDVDYKTGNLDDIYQAILAQGETLNQMVKLLVQNNRDNQEIISYLMKMNKSMDQIVDLLKEAGKSLGDIFAVVSNMELEQSKQTELITKIVNGNKDAGKYLEAILNAIKDGNKISQGNQELLKNILDKMDGLGKGQEGIQDSLNKLLALVQESITTNKEIGKNTQDLINKVIEAIGNIKIEGGGGTVGDNSKVLAALDKITELLEKSIKQDKDIGDKQEALLTQLIDLVSKIGAKLDVDLSKLIKGVENGNIKLDEIKTLIAELTKLVNEGNENNKILGDKILKYLEKFGYDMNANFSAILNAINNIEAGGGDTSSIVALLEKVLKNQEKNMETQDKNAKAIIEAMGKIKFEAGDVNIDLSSLEKMLQELLAQSKKNGNILTDIDAKLDAIKVTGDAILAKIKDESAKNDNRYATIVNLMENIFKKLGEQQGAYDDSELLAVLDKWGKIFQGKLDDILAAIKDHDVKVTVDVTGKVTCECDCGKNHEGILGELLG